MSQENNVIPVDFAFRREVQEQTSLNKTWYVSPSQTFEEDLCPCCRGRGVIVRHILHKKNANEDLIRVSCAQCLESFSIKFSVCEAGARRLREFGFNKLPAEIAYRNWVQDKEGK